MSSLSLTEPQIEAMPAEEVLRWAYDAFGERLCLTCSWQKQSSVLVHLVSELGLGIDVIELDTHLFFKESYETREALVERYDLNLIQPKIITVAEQHKHEGPNLWESNPDRCCHIRKVEPLIRALDPYDAWISGIRRDQRLACLVALLEEEVRVELDDVDPESELGDEVDEHRGLLLPGAREAEPVPERVVRPAEDILRRHRLGLRVSQRQAAHRARSPSWCRPGARV